MTEELKKQKEYFDELAVVVKMINRLSDRKKIVKVKKMLSGYEDRFEQLTDLIIQNQ